MTRLVHVGAETGDTTAEGLTAAGSTLTYDTGTMRTGTRSWKFDTSATCTLSYAFTGATARRYWSCVYVLFPSATGLPGSDARILQFQTGAAGVLCSARITTAGKVQLLNQAGTQIGSDSAATLGTDTWYRIELAVEIGAGAVDYTHVFLDGVSVASGSAESLSDTAPGILMWGWIDDPGTSEVLFADDLSLNDSQGSVNNTWVGPSAVYLLLPASDNADGGWTAGGGGTSLFAGVDNTPPAGVASPGTNTSQIGNAVSSTTDNADLNLASYTTAGIGSSDSVSAVYGIVIAGNSSTTGTDTLRISVQSNPVIAETAPVIDIVVGTYPTGWNRLTLAMTENPTITKGTSPVMRVGKNIANVRRANVCFMGLYVGVSTPTTIGAYSGSWTPANLSTAPRAFWMADDVTGSDGDTLISWLDRSGNAYTITQSTASLRPTVQTNELNGHDTVRFDGTDDYLTIASVVGLTAQPISIFAVWKVAASGQQSLMQAINDTIGEFKTSGGDMAHISGGFGLIQSGMSAAGWYLTSGEHSGASGQSAINGVTFSGNPGTNVPATGINVGANRTPGDYLNGDIAAIVISSAAWSATERQYLEGWAAHTFGLQANLAATHPFKLSPPQYPSLAKRPAGNRAFLRR